jgi:deoxyadenosine/deoxycytidine kinase
MKPAIIIEGNIGSGKSFLAERLAIQFGVELFPEFSHDGLEKKILPLFYEDMKMYAFKNQLAFLSNRLHAERTAFLKGGVLDRGVQGIHMFNKMLRDSQYIAHHEYMLLLRVLQFEEVGKALQGDDHPVFRIYLRSTPLQCLDRVRDRNRDGEDVDLAYLVALHNRHEAWYEENKDEVFLIERDGLDFKEDLSPVLEMLSA